MANQFLQHTPNTVLLTNVVYEGSSIIYLKHTPDVILIYKSKPSVEALKYTRSEVECNSMFTDRLNLHVLVPHNLSGMHFRFYGTPVNVPRSLL